MCLVSRTMIVGVTGRIASGKTTVVEAFSRLGISVVDADVIARRLLSAGSDCYKKVLHTFNEDLLLEDNGEIDRKYLSDLVFNHASKRLQLEEILHPVIKKALQAALLNQQKPYQIACIPLLFENNLQSLVDRVLYVDCDTEIIIRRLSKRNNFSKIKSKKILAIQYPKIKALKLATERIKNTGSCENLMQSVVALHQFYIEMSENYE